MLYTGLVDRTFSGADLGRVLKTPVLAETRNLGLYISREMQLRTMKQLHILVVDTYMYISQPAHNI